MSHLAEKLSTSYSPNLVSSSHQALGLECVCAVTRCTDFISSHSGGDGSDVGQVADRYAAYVDARNERGHSPDRGLNFHIQRGAEVIRCVPGWRPDDEANCGFGVLVEYSLNSLGRLERGSEAGGEAGDGEASTTSEIWNQFEHVVEAVSTIVQDVLGKQVPVDAPLMDVGLDSLHITQLVRRLGERLKRQCRVAIFGIKHARSSIRH